MQNQQLAAALIHNSAQVLRQYICLSVTARLPFTGQSYCVWSADLLTYVQQYKTDLDGGEQKLTKSKAMNKLN